MAIKKTMLFLLLITSPVLMMAKQPIKPARDKRYVSANRLQDAANDAVDTCTARCRSCCPVGWVRNGDKCYFIDDTPTPKLADARAVCKNMGGDLAIIKSAEENEFIRSLVMQQNTTTAFGAWLGFKRIKVDSKIYWHDDTLVEGGYTNWGRGEPNRHQLYQQNEDCGNIYATTGTWNDFFCDFSLGNPWDGWTSEDSPVILCQKNL